jgi:hypothetical protein
MLHLTMLSRVTCHLNRSLDMVVSAAGGAATAAVRAYTSGNPVTSQVSGLGVLGGVIKSGVRAFGIFVSLHTSSYTTLTLKFLLLSFGLSLFVTNAVAQRVMWPGEPVLPSGASLGMLIPT